MQYAKIKCHQEKCNNEYAMKDLQRILSSQRFTQLDEALTIKFVRGNEEYVSCPNKQCSNVCFTRPENYCCSEDVECEAC